MLRLFCRAAHGGRRVGIALAVALLAGLTGVVAGVPSALPASAESATSGYWLVGTDGGIFSYGNADFFGSTGGIKLNQPVVGMAATPDGRGYWMVASDGGIFAFGNAKFYGSMGGKPLNKPIVAMAASRTGKGYWLVASDGGIFAFGDASFHGSLGAIKLNKPIVDFIPTPSGRGYWMAASDGGIFSFGDAGYFGSTGAINLSKRIQQMAATPSGKGYWLVAGDGGIFSFGDAGFFGSAAGGTEKRVVDIAPSATGKGYYITASNGEVFTYGDAKHHGQFDGKLNHGIIAMVPLNSGAPPVASNDVAQVNEDGTVTVDVLANDSDPDGGVLVIHSVGLPLHGTATVDNGRILYQPKANYHGTDTFSYTVIDTNGHTAVGLVSVTIHSVDDLPRATNDAKTVSLGQTVTIDVLANDSGLGDGFADLSIRQGPSKGKITKSADGRSIVYTATKKGADQIVYWVFDADGDNAEGVVNITVTGPSPKAPDIGSVNCTAGACSVDVSQADGYSPGNGGMVKLAGVDGNTKDIDGGQFSVQDEVITFTATRGNVGMVSVEYQVVDIDGDSDTGTVTFNYANSAPSAQGGTVSVSANVPLDLQLTASDADGDAPTFELVSIEPADPGVTVTIEPNGMLHFSGAPGGTVWSVNFLVKDAHGGQSSATYTITVNM